MKLSQKQQEALAWLPSDGNWRLEEEGCPWVGIMKLKYDGLALVEWIDASHHEKETAAFCLTPAGVAYKAKRKP